MPERVRTLERTVAYLRGLAAQVAENASSLPDLTAEKNALDKALELFDEARKRQKIYTAERQKATQDMMAALVHGKEAARQIRFAAQLGLGARNEKLVLFNVAPLRTKAGRKASILQPPDEPSPSETTGETTAAPPTPAPEPTDP